MIRIPQTAFTAMSRSVIPVNTARIPTQPIVQHGVDSVRFSSHGYGVSTNSSTESEPVYQYYKGRATEIDWDSWAVSSVDRPLATTGLEMCRALMIVDDTHQFMAHLLPEASVEEIEDALEEAHTEYGLDLEDSELFVMQGSQDNEALDQNIKLALNQFGRDSSEINFLHRGENRSGPVGVALVHGEVRLCESHKPPNWYVEQHPVGTDPI
jgi:hypothetical protein